MIKHINVLHSINHNLTFPSCSFGLLWSSANRKLAGFNTQEKKGFMATSARLEATMEPEDPQRVRFQVISDIYVGDSLKNNCRLNWSLSSAWPILITLTSWHKGDILRKLVLLIILNIYNTGKTLSKLTF